GVAQAGGRLPRGAGAGGRAAGEERRLSEQLAGPEFVARLALVYELDRAASNDEQVLGRRPVLDQRGLAGVVRAFDRARRHRGELRRREGVEGREPGQERGNALCVHRLHCSPSIPVAPSLVMIVSFWELPLSQPILARRRRWGPRSRKSSTTQAAV